MNKSLFHYLWSPINIPQKEVSNYIPYVALLSAVATVLQSTGNYIPIIGLFISPFATLPIMLAASISMSSVILTYILSAFLIVILQPTEFFTFPFTTGLLGLSFGIGLLVLRRRMFIFITSSILLFGGIIFLLFVINFPVLGPFYPSTLSDWLIIKAFTFFYSWMFFEVCFFLHHHIIKRLIV